MRNILSFEILIVKVSKVSSLRKCSLTLFDGLFEILELVNFEILEILVSMRCKTKKLVRVSKQVEQGRLRSSISFMQTIASGADKRPKTSIRSCTSDSEDDDGL